MEYPKDIMYRISVKREFDAAHRLEDHPGKCSRLHGHTWTVEAVLRNTDIDEGGFVLDFGDAGAMLEEVVSRFDHGYLNEIPPFTSLPPTAENISRILFDQLTGRVESLPGGTILESVKVWESSNNWASYSLE
ncbi:MAG: 6-carboxytetrahydropterin synthase QueD [Actinobacteria bacterium]|nr:6-carboxytetrahydropterin synthase QueD [Actinomycetota bacterium]